MTVEGDPTGLIHAYALDGAGGGESLDWNGIERWQPDAGVLGASGMMLMLFRKWRWL